MWSRLCSLRRICSATARHWKKPRFETWPFISSRRHARMGVLKRRGPRHAGSRCARDQDGSKSRARSRSCSPIEFDTWPSLSHIVESPSGHRQSIAVVQCWQFWARRPGAPQTRLVALGAGPVAGHRRSSLWTTCNVLGCGSCGKNKGRSAGTVGDYESIEIGTGPHHRDHPERHAPHTLSRPSSQPARPA